ncbi:Pentatricopeptide repeat-containing protein [Camellia lanceoleosa]|uniref:Pentatricopeptide repeat-containing protein n=1 Tax=Camellia lanceoleosa TaxID=1840588 RepID=A0ACC0IN53_9ERIC|nr:Pentatricopeptide repeat-containing protein [Camellia lanceoleosa]
MSGSWREVERRILHLLHGCKTRTQLTQIHAHFLRHHLHQSNQILSHFISVCFSLHRISYANLIFHQTHNPNIFLFNSMIKGHSLSKPFQNSLQFFTIMKSLGIWPNEFTFAPLLKSCSNLLDLKMGQGVHKEVISVGFESFSSIRIGIVELYVSCGMMEDAMKVFDEMPHRDVIVWNLMIRGFCEIGDFEMGFRLFRQMSEWSVVSWNVMISSLARSGRENEVLEIFCQMQDNGFKPDEATVVSVLPVCARLEAVDIGQWIHSYAKSSGLYRDFISIGNSLVDFYCKCGILETAFTVFKDMPRKNVVSWNAMISGLAFNGKGELGVDLFEEMLSKDVKPNDATFVGVLACCAHAGLVQQGLDLFASMTTKHQIEPKLEHYGSMVDLLGRSGCVKEAHDLIRTMPMNPNATIWGALLSACCTHDKMELAESAVKELTDLEPWNSGNYVLLSNVYAKRGKWDEVEKVRALMMENRINKAPGQSMVG